VTGSTVSFAFVAGTVATVNPCGFALLPAYLARRVGAEDGTRKSADAVSRALVVGAVTTAGFMLVFGTIGTAIGLGARELTHALPWAGLVIGVALVLAGAAVLAGGHLRLRLPRFSCPRVALVCAATCCSGTQQGLARALGRAGQGGVSMLQQAMLELVPGAGARRLDGVPGLAWLVRCG